jgi:hypothetical protein
MAVSKNGGYPQFITLIKKYKDLETKGKETKTSWAGKDVY